MEKKLQNISFIKTIMMVLVVLYHCMLFFGGNWFVYTAPVYNAKYLYKIAMWFNSFHIQTFAMASGFLFYYLKREHNKYNNPKEDIKKRAKRLLIPYLTVSLIWVMPIATFFFNYSLKEIIINFVLMKNPNQLWFLIMLFLVFVFFEIFSDKFKISLNNFIVLFFVSTGGSTILEHFGINYFQIAQAIKYLLFFYLGGYIYVNKERITLKQAIIMIIGAFVLYSIKLNIKHLNISMLKYALVVINPIISILEVSVVYYICTKALEKKLINPNNNIYKILEANSFGIYLFHQQLIYFTILKLNGLVHPMIQTVLAFVISLITSLLMSVILKRNKITKKLFGL